MNRPAARFAWPGRFLLLSSLLGLVPAAGAPGAPGSKSTGAIVVDNFTDGETVRYSTPLLRGTLADKNATTVTLVNESSKRATREMTGTARAGRFKVLAELVPGENRLVLKSGAHRRRLTLHFKAQTNPYHVRVFYFTDNTGETDFQTPRKDDPQDYAGKLDTAMKLMQSFTAESMRAKGHGRKTFNLKLGEDGRVQVQRFRGRHPAPHYFDDLWGKIAREINRTRPDRYAKNVVVMAFTRFDPATNKVTGHTALGGGNIGLFGSGNLFTWPDRLQTVQQAFLDARPIDPQQVFSDSVGRHTYWSAASTTIGATLHELGHTFGLPHSDRRHDIMTRGFDRFNRFFTFRDPPHRRRKRAYHFKAREIAEWSPVSAAALAPSRWFAIDRRTYTNAKSTSVRIDANTADAVVHSPHGLRFVGYGKPGRASHFAPIGPDTPAPKTVRIAIEDIGKALRTEDVRLRVVDAHGNIDKFNLTTLLLPHVVRWRFAKAAVPWTDRGKFVPLDDKRIAAIVADAKKQPPHASTQPMVDFLPRFPRKTNVAGYALRTIKTSVPRTVKVLTGSDDALRVWLNGKVAFEVLKLRSAVPDSETHTLELPAGANTLLVEVSQATGGWGLYLRFANEKGEPLALTDDGRLVPAGRRIHRMLLGGGKK